MSEKSEIQAELRSDVGKGASRRLRRLEDKVPAIIYGASKEPIKISVKQNEICHALENESFYSQILTINLDGKKEKVVLKDIQRHVYKPKVNHLDFLRVSATEKLKMHIPLHFLGEEEAPGVNEGGTFSHTITDLEVTCLPGALPEFIQVDVSKMEMDSVLHISDIKLPKDVELQQPVETHGENDHPVVSLHLQRIQEEPEPETEETEEGAESSESEDKGSEAEEGGEE